MSVFVTSFYHQFNSIQISYKISNQPKPVKTCQKHPNKPQPPTTRQNCSKSTYATHYLIPLKTTSIHNNAKQRLIVLKVPYYVNNPPIQPAFTCRNDKSTRTRCEICSKLTIKTPKRCHLCRCSVFIANFEHILHLVLLFLLLTLNMSLPAGYLLSWGVLPKQIHYVLSHGLLKLD